MLAAHFDDHDIIGQWMAYHLAELVRGAQDESTTSIEQRKQIIEIILDIWSHRSHYPRPAPLEQFDSILAALDRLGDDSPWRFSRLFGLTTKIPELSTCGLPLVTTAAELERLVRETLLGLIWLAAQEAKDKDEEWLEVADKVATNLESDVITALERLQRRVARRHAVAADHSVVNAIVPPVEDADNDGEPEPAINAPAKDTTADSIIESDTDYGGTDSFDHEDETNGPLSMNGHVKRLREMAALLNKIADALPASPDV
jgi:hypothetical protein